MIKRSKRLIPVVLYGCFYLACFHWLERTPTRYHIINSSLDNKIPFCEYFIIPYFLWFFYIAATVLFFMYFNDSNTEYWNLIINLGLGMTLFLIVSYVYPNGLAIRPHVFPRDNFCTTLVKYLYKIDTPTNVLPSIHVYNSTACYCAINSCHQLQRYKWVRHGSLILTTLIVLSTMFLKQHSICDVATGITFAVASYIVIYKVYAKSSQRAARRHSTLY